MSKLRAWAPSAVTAIGMLFAALSVRATIDGDHRTAAWWAAYCLLTDKLDGAVARALDARSAFGAQLDSLADFLAYGVAPAALYYAFFTGTPGAGWDNPLHRGLLLAIVFFHLLCVAARLARFNATGGGPGGGRYFLGWSSPYIGGMLTSLLLVAMKYGEPAWTAADPSSDDVRLFGEVSLVTPARYLPYVMIPLGLAMISNLRMPNTSRARTLGNALVVLAIVAGAVIGLARQLPEYLAVGGALYGLLSLRYHLVAPDGPGERPPPWFPDPPPRP